MATLLRNTGHATALLTVLVIALGLRWKSAAESLWIDELHSSWVVAGSWEQVAPRARIGNQSPLFYRAQWLLTRASGSSERTLRAISLFSGGLLCAGSYALARSWSKDRLSALLVFWLAAWDKDWVFYAAEARPYAAVQLLGLLHLMLWVRRLRGSASWSERVAYLATGGLLFHLHYTTGLLLLAEALCLLVRPRRGAIPARPPGHIAALDLSLLSLICLPALPQLFALAARRQAWEAFIQPQPWPALATLFRANWYLGPALLAVASAALLTRLARRHVGARLPGRRFEITVALTAWWLVPVLTAWCLTQFHIAPVFLTRYLIASSLGVLILTGLLASQIPWPAVRLLCLGATAGLALFANGYGRWWQHGVCPFARNENWRQLVVTLVEQMSLGAATEQPILLRSGLIEADRPVETWSATLRDYLGYPVRGLYRLPEYAVVEPLRNNPPHGITPSLRERVWRAGGAWLVVRARRDRALEIAESVCRELDVPGLQPSGRHEFGRLFLIELRITAHAAAEAGLSEPRTDAMTWPFSDRKARGRAAHGRVGIPAPEGSSHRGRLL